MFRFLLLPWLLAAICRPGSLHGEDAGPLLVLDPHSYFLGALGAREWSTFDGRKPHGRSLEIRFTARQNPQPSTLFIRQKDVKLVWPVAVNGKRIGKLDLMEGHVVSCIELPGGTLRDGENVLSILSPGAPDDIMVGEIKLDVRRPEEALQEASIHVEVLGHDGRALPCRLTIVDSQGALTPVFAKSGQLLAVRSGVVYTGNGRADLGLPAGEYTLYATRGMEYGLVTRKLTLTAGQDLRVALELAREVITPRLAASDTHVHTLTFSGHGDCTVDERALTLAGEGIELAISTEHNRYDGCADAARRMHVEQYFTDVIGDEVTTPAGHFNVFPVADPNGPQPDFKLTDWPALMASIRATAKPQVIILNHPRDVHNNFIPFDAPNFNPVTGDNLRGSEFSFDAVEVANSGAMQSDFMRSYRDWFALLNHGYRVTAVGSSDSHDVSRYIVGQARSYVECAHDRPSHISVDEACRSFKAGKVCVSLGLLTTMTVNRTYRMGDLVTGIGDALDVNIVVQGPSWVTAEKVELYANGVKIREQSIPSGTAPGVKASVSWSIPKPAHDVYLVAIASGPGVEAPYWKQAPPYQPSSRDLHPRAFGSTNPIWIDADNDGKFTSARAYAQSLVARSGGEPATIVAALATYDEAVAAQAAALCHASGRNVRSAEFNDALKSASPAVQRGFQAFIDTIVINH